MNAFIKHKGQKWLGFVVKNPKRFYMYSMIFLSVSFFGSLIQGIFFPSDKSFRIKPPLLYSDQNVGNSTISLQDEEMKKIIGELKLLKVKRDRNALHKEDSLRIEFLFNQYQQLKHGH